MRNMIKKLLGILASIAILLFGAMLYSKNSSSEVAGILDQLNNFTTHEFLKRSPISTRLSVNISKDSIENGNAKARKTCELFIKLLMAMCSSTSLFPLVMNTQISTGMTDKSRVIKRRRGSTGFLIWRPAPRGYLS